MSRFHNAKRLYGRNDDLDVRQRHTPQSSFIDMAFRPDHIGQFDLLPAMEEPLADVLSDVSRMVMLFQWRDPHLYWAVSDPE